MEAFQHNIDALERKIKAFIQKWKEAREENELLLERNRQLELKIAELMSDQDGQKSITTGQHSDNMTYSVDISKALEQYIAKVDRCISKLNKELDE